MHRMRSFVIVLAAAALAVGVTACGDDDSAPSASTAPPAAAGDATAGKAVFGANCGGCHTLSDAEATGSNGPNLDELKPSLETVQGQVTNGGGGMPAFADSLSEAEILNVATYVSSVAGS